MLFQKKILNQLNYAQKKLENILDFDHLEKINTQNKKFEIETNLSFFNIADIDSDLSTQEKVIVLFSRLTLYFNSGVLLTLNKELNLNDAASLKVSTNFSPDGLWSPTAAFYHNQYRHIPNELLSQKLRLGSFKVSEIKKTAPYKLLKPLHLEDLSDHSDSSCFVFRIHSDFIFALIIDIPEPWLRHHVEQIHRKLAHFEL